MTFRTEVSEATPGHTVLRGYEHRDLMRAASFVEMAFLVLTGRLPSPAEARVVEVMMTSILDHGFVSVTTTTGRYAASGNPQLVPAIAAGLLAAGTNTLSPQACSNFLKAVQASSEQQSVEEAATAAVAATLAQGHRIPGLGHPIHRDTDYRADALFAAARQERIFGQWCQLLITVHQAYVTQTGRSHHPINIDGVLAAVGLDMGLTTLQTTALAIIGVVPGLAAHIIEEITTGSPLRYATDVQYVGPRGRALGNPTVTSPVAES